jgi:hypothetical protein
MKSLMGNHPNEWAFTPSLIDQEGDTRRVFVNNVAGMDIEHNGSPAQQRQQGADPVCCAADLYLSISLIVSAVRKKFV